jgi:hypothetical protein
MSNLLYKFTDFWPNHHLLHIEMPGKDDYISLKAGGAKTHEHKQLSLCDLKEFSSKIHAQESK